MRVGFAERYSGFTLIEILIVVVAVSILIALAYPRYLEQVHSSRRADAKQALMGLASAMERHHSRMLTYRGAAIDGEDAGAPAIFASEAPLDGARKYYNLRIVAASADDFRIRALPKNDQAADGFLQLAADGRRAWDRDNDGAIDEPGEACWRRVC